MESGQDDARAGRAERVGRGVVRFGRRGSEQSAFERWGGEPFFVGLVDRFYARVESDPVLLPLYPEDLTDPKTHLALFLMQYWGGPRSYSEQRGHPRLRMRHAPFTIGPVQADAWLAHMTASVREAALPPADEAELLDYLAMAARTLINSDA